MNGRLYMSRFLLAAITAVFVAGCFLLTACAVNEKDLKSALSEAVRYERSNKYSSAAESFLTVELYSKDPQQKASALLRAARAYRQAKLYGNELKCLKRLTKEHVNRIDFTKVVVRMYEIGDVFYDGHHDTIVSWLPFIHDEDCTEDAYATAIKLAPCAPQAPRVRLRLAVYHMENGKPLQAVEEFKEIMSLHPGTPAARNSFIELANLYSQLAQKGDGDGKWSRLAAEQLDSFIKEYPNDPEIPWAKRERARIDTLIIKRLHGMAQYYHRTGQDDVAKRYLGKIVKNYGATTDTEDSEALLASIDKNYVPPVEGAPRKETPKIQIQRNTIPLERTRIIVIPENSDGRFLLPIMDLDPGRVRDSRDVIPERPISEDDI